MDRRKADGGAKTPRVGAPGPVMSHWCPQPLISNTLAIERQVGFSSSNFTVKVQE